MFSLLEFHNETLSIVKTSTVEIIDKKNKTCIVKIKGAKYSAFLLKKNDLKAKKEQHIRSTEIGIQSSGKIKKKCLESSTYSDIFSNLDSPKHIKILSNKSCPINFELSSADTGFNSPPISYQQNRNDAEIFNLKPKNVIEIRKEEINNHKENSNVSIDSSIEKHNGNTDIFAAPDFRKHNKTPSNESTPTDFELPSTETGALSPSISQQPNQNDADIFNLKPQNIIENRVEDIIKLNESVDSTIAKHNGNTDICSEPDSSMHNKIPSNESCPTNFDPQLTNIEFLSPSVSYQQNRNDVEIFKSQLKTVAESTTQKHNSTSVSKITANTGNAVVSSSLEIHEILCITKHKGNNVSIDSKNEKHNGNTDIFSAPNSFKHNKILSNESAPTDFELPSTEIGGFPPSISYQPNRNAAEIFNLKLQNIIEVSVEEITKHNENSNVSFDSTIEKHNGFSDIFSEPDSSMHNKMPSKESCPTNLELPSTDTGFLSPSVSYQQNRNDAEIFKRQLKAIPELTTQKHNITSLSEITVNTENVIGSSPLAIHEIPCITKHKENSNISLDSTIHKHNGNTGLGSSKHNKTSLNESFPTDFEFASTYSGFLSPSVSHKQNHNVAEIYNNQFKPIPESTTQKHNSTSLSEITVNTENLISSSSLDIHQSSCSEYIPDSTIGTSRGNLEISNNSISEQNQTVEVIETPIIVTEVKVLYSKNKSKKHFCVFCKTLQSKISRHLFLKHKGENEVKRASILPKKNKERLKIINILRKKGDFLHNTIAEHNTGILIVSRQQQNKCKNNADDYVCCKNCKGYFSKRTLGIHTSNCISHNKKRSTLTDSRRMTQYLHPIANKILKTKIFPVMRDDKTSKSLRYDELIIKYGNKLSEKYSSEHQHDMIRAQLRLLGRFKIEMQKLDTEIIELKDIYRPKFFDKCIEAIRTVAHWDDDLRWFETPAVAVSLTALIKKCAKKQRTELIKEECVDLNDLDRFLLLWEEETPTLINKKAHEDQSNKKRVKKVFFPIKEDIQKLYLHLKGNIVKAMERLNNGFCMPTWTALVEATLIFIQIFNRRRAGEIERMTIENFENKEVITESIDKDILKNVSSESINLARKFVRITIRGKLGRDVFVLLWPMCVSAINFVLKYRKEAGITDQNKYIFSKPSNNILSKQYFRACPLIKKFSEECGAEVPESLRGTNLRKHIATFISLLNIEDSTVDRLANFMGHHKDVHKNIYRMSIPVAEITCVSKLLMAAVGDEEEDGDAYDDNVEEENNELRVEEFSGNSEFNRSLLQDNTSSSSKKKRSTSPIGKTKRCRWNADEQQAITSIFGDIQNLRAVPSLKECYDAISQAPALNKRTPQQIKSWIDNKRRYNKGNKVKGRSL